MAIIYHTLCRLDCFMKLQARHFELVGPDIVVTFPAAKNDQFHKGNQSCLVATGTAFCPVRITRIFFFRFGLRFGEAEGDLTFVNFQLRKADATSRPIPGSRLSRSQATADLGALLRAAGVQVRATEKSIKMAGVSAMFQAGATALEVMHTGRWNSPDIPLRYKHNSHAFKRAVAAKVTPLPD